ncbi:stage II sporulation protein M [Paenibacillus sp. Z6-24]
MFSIRTFWNDLRNNRTMLLVSVALFVIGIILGVWLAVPLGQYLEKQLEQLRGVTEQLQQSNHVELSYFILIFFNNVIKSILIIYLGALLGILPVIFLVMNGMMIGFLVYTRSTEGVDLVTLIVKGLLPHGIIEIPAILIAAAYGLKFGKLILDSLTTWDSAARYRLKTERRQFMRSTVTAAFWIVILLLVAAGIESTITYWLVRG